MLILASCSKARRELLDQAGLRYEVLPADIDEEAVQNADLPPANIAALLAREKALVISCRYSEALVIGSDQVLSFEGRCLSKSTTEEEAIQRLRTMLGKSHQLVTSVCVAQENKILWEETVSATLWMADLTDEFLTQYRSVAGSALTDTVGGYEIEGVGIQLFEKIEGDYFSILGLPLLPLLGFLRTRKGLDL